MPSPLISGGRWSQSWGAIQQIIWYGTLEPALAGCLFGSVPVVVALPWLGPFLQEVLATFRDPGTQWMVFACGGVYFATFMLVQHRAKGGRFWRLSNPDVWLTAALVLSAVRYGFGYGGGGGCPEALVLLGSAALGKGAAVRTRREKGEGRREKAERITAIHRTSNIERPTPNAMEGKADSEPGILKAEDAVRESALLRDAAPALENKPDWDRRIDDKEIHVPASHFPVIVPVLSILLVTAVFWQDETGRQFQYREQARWSGPWDNPNVFGMLMGVGVVLAIGMLVSAFRFQASGSSGKSVVRSQWAVVSGWLQVVLCLAAAGILGFGLLKSYSRGAWLGAVVGLGWLTWECWDRGIRGIREKAAASHLTPALSPHPMGGEGEVDSHDSRDSWGWRLLRWNAVSLAVIIVSVAVLGFWSFRHTEQVVARRAFSAGNVDDFSWRNRVAAWSGALQMMGERPWLGFGWNRPERVHEQYYRAPSVHEGMAIQLNDFLMFGATLGLPALVCFLAYTGLSMAGSQWSVVSSPWPVARGPRVEATDNRLLATSFAKMTCHAGAIVLLVAFWFDGGLFRLATASVFWVLIEVGREA